MGNASITKAMRGAGIPTSYLHTTLLKVGHPDLRSLLVGEAMATDEGLKGVAFCCKSPRDMSEARKVFYLFAKENVLYGRSLVVANLYQLAENADFSISRADDFRLRHELLFVPGFYEHGAEKPFDGTHSYRIRAYLSYLVEVGVGVCPLMDCRRISQASAWWPESFLAFLAEHVVEYVVGD